MSAKRIFSRSVLFPKEASLLKQKSLSEMKTKLQLTQSNKTSLFRTLTGKEEEAVSVLDNRDIFGINLNQSQLHPNNDLFLVCDHASNELKFIKPREDEQPFLNSAEGYDPGAAEFVNALSERMNCMAILTSFSKLIIDPSLPLNSMDLIPTHYRSK